MALNDIWEQTMVTALLKRNLEERHDVDAVAGEDRSFFGRNIAPLVAEDNHVSRVVFTDVVANGLGQFKAPDATPPLYKPTTTKSEKLYELVLLEEMERMPATEWAELQSSDDELARKAKLNMIERLRILNQRNERRTEWMRWEMFKGGTLDIDYRDGGTVSIDYGFLAGHQPTAGTLWTDTVNADPVEDMYAWSQVGSDDAGEYYSIVHLNSEVWRLITRNENIQAYLSSLGRQILLPTRDDLAQLMREGTANFELIDSGYLPEGATGGPRTKFMPDDHILMTTRYQLDGQNIADVADGPVLVGGGVGEEPQVRRGLQAEIITEPFSKNVFRRVATSRIPRMYYPEAFLYATVA